MPEDIFSEVRILTLISVFSVTVIRNLALENTRIFVSVIQITFT